MTIIWSLFAEKQLDEIFDYYSKKVSHQLALKIVLELIEAPEILKRNPLVGPIEEFLKGRHIEYRYLICTNYKIIYSVDEENNCVKISDVFDTRQNPSKIKRSNNPKT
ncbi:MAG: type II toxin-antitoxin system RelE/ParE family toxin [Mongoliitalea sp.]